jgi:hypothetical protein
VWILWFFSEVKKQLPVFPAMHSGACQIRFFFFVFGFRFDLGLFLAVFIFVFNFFWMVEFIHRYLLARSMYCMHRKWHGHYA